MNCREFETIINDIARERMLEASVREEGLAHAGACPRCAARLADECALTGALRAVAASDASGGAPPRVETALREAFRTRESSGANPELERPARAARWPRWAAAAAILVVSGAVALQLRRAPVEQVAEAPPGPSSRVTQPGTSAPPLVNREHAVPGTKHESVEAEPIAVSNNAGSGRAVKASRAMKRARPVDTGDVEIATEFLPVTYGGSFAPLESGQVVRVELPRSALASVGLPMNADRARERVKADVVVGHDGLVRAIRFVQ
jgi:hypothetical protein